MQRGSQILPEGQTPIRHGLGFLISGSIAFAVDALIMTVLTGVFGVHPIIARLGAISMAMVAGWRAHRRLTFAVATKPSLPEFLRYAGVAWTAAAINYGLFVLILLVRPSTEPFVALVASSLGAMIFAYLGMRFAAFRRHSHTSRD